MKFRVISHLTHDGKVYEAGASVDMTEAQAAKIPWAVEALPLPPPAPEKKASK